MTINEQKLALASHRKNPLRDKLRAMTNEQLLAEKAKATKAQNAKDTRANFNYMMFVDYLCEARGLTKPTPGISA